MPVRSNISISSLARRRARAAAAPDRPAQGAPAHGRRRASRPASRRALLGRRIRVLSGGNQQKSLLARWLMRRADLLVLIEPTRGVDVGAKLEIYRELEELAASGRRDRRRLDRHAGERSALSDRIAVLYQGRARGRVRPARGERAGPAARDAGRRRSCGDRSVSAGATPVEAGRRLDRAAVARPLALARRDVRDRRDRGRAPARASGSPRASSCSRRTSATSSSQISVVGVAAIGETIVMLAGGLDLSVGSVVLLERGDLRRPDGDAPLRGRARAARGARRGAAAIGLLNGVLVAVVGIEPILATLGTLLVAAGLAKLILGLRYLQVGDPVLQRPRGHERPLQPADHGRGHARAVRRRRRSRCACTPFGRMVYARRRQPRGRARCPGSRSSGSRSPSTSSPASSPASPGFLNIAQLGLVSQNDAMGMEFRAIIAALVGGLSVTAGGVGRVERTLLGALIVGMIDELPDDQGVDRRPSSRRCSAGLLLRGRARRPAPAREAVMRRLGREALTSTRGSC